jgi:hypothetical protein
MNAGSLLSKNKILLLVAPNLAYHKKIVELVRKLSNKKVCFVTLNKTYQAIEGWLIFKKINVKKLIFVDAISDTLGIKTKDSQIVHYVSSPIALGELRQAISRIMLNVDYVIFDSISSLSAYYRAEIIVKFVLALINDLKAKNVKSVFFILDADKSLAKCSKIFDKVLNIELIQ